jgi:uncharacterized phage protein gp47/JayE
VSVNTTLPTFPTVAEVLAGIQSALEALNPLLTNYNPGGATETFLESLALLTGSDASTYPGVVTESAYEILTTLQTAEFILTATGSFLDLKAADVGVTRKAATYAGGPVQFSITGQASIAITIPSGSLVAAESADPTAMPIVYRTLANATIPINGDVSNIVQVEAINAGANGNQSFVGAINTVISGGTNVTVASTSTIGGGADTEGDDTPNGGLRARALAAIPNASQCTISAIENAALSYAGIVTAVAQDINSDPTLLRGVVQLYVDDGSGDLANSSNANYPILATMQMAFDSGLYRAAGVQVNVQGSELLATTISLILYLNANYAAVTTTPATTVSAVQLAIFTYCNAIAIGAPVSIAEIIRYACDIAGVSDVPVTSVLINGANQNLQPTAVQAARIANLSDITITYALVNY